LKANFKKVKEQIDFEQNVNKLIDKAIILAAQINVKEIKSGLDTSTGPKGKLKKLKASTARQKRKKGYPIKPLVATGTMRRLPPVKHTKGKAFNEIAKSRAKIAQYHEQGAGKLPKREFFDLYPSAVRKIERMIKKKLIKLFSKL
jgi:hypothetical protein